MLMPINNIHHSHRTEASIILENEGHKAAVDYIRAATGRHIDDCEATVEQIAQSM